MEGFLPLIILLVVIYFSFFYKKTKEVIAVPKNNFKEIFDKYGILDYRTNPFLIKSIKHALSNEIFEYDEIDTGPIFPILNHSSDYQKIMAAGEVLYNNDKPISEIITQLINKEGEENINDYMINEIYEVLSKFRTERINYYNERNFYENYLKEIGLISEEKFFIEGETIIANRTLLNDSIVFKHGGTKNRLINYKFSKDENENRHEGLACNYFEQILIKIIRENALYLEIQRNNIFSSINQTINPNKIILDTETHNLINRISYALNKKISNSIPSNNGEPNFLSISQDRILPLWLNTRDSLNFWIDLYHKLLEAYLSKDNLTLYNVLCHFERGNYLLSSDTISLVNSISDFKSEVLESISELEYSISGKIEDVKDDMESKLDEVKSAANAATLAGTAAAVQSTRVLKRLKKK